MPPAMHHCEDDDLISDRAKEDGVGKASEDGPADVAMNSRKRHRLVCNRADDPLNLGNELAAKSAPALLVPIARLSGLGYCLRPKDDPAGHLLARSFRRTSAQDTADSGSRECSASRRS